ncbi:uncharacterized protein [Panulirus ornatus]|uniref:uncharacterized protein isoform X2 n=1 Tax=Panulirus ornatus TaxID=150431 RepID=UPI003A876847
MTRRPPPPHKMRLGLALWWAMVTVGVVGRARAPPPPPQDTPPQDTHLHDPPLLDTSTHDPVPLDTSTHDPASLDTSTHDLAPLDTSTHDPAPLETSTHDLAPLDTSTHDPAPLDTSTHDLAPLDTSTYDLALLDTSTHDLPSLDTSTHDPRPVGISTPDTAPLETSTHDPPSLDTFTHDPPSLDTSTPDPASLETSTHNPPLLDTSTHDPPSLDTSTHDPRPVDTSTHDPPSLDTSTHDPRPVATSTRDPPSLDTPTHDPPSLDTSTPDPTSLETSTHNPPLLDTSTHDPPSLGTSTHDPRPVDTSTPDPPSLDTPTHDPPSVDASTPDPPPLGTSTPDPASLGTSTHDPPSLDTSTPLQDTPTQDKLLQERSGERGTQMEAVHAEELLEKYGYLECVPPGSESNTHLHRLLLYRTQRYVETPRYDPLDFRLTDTDMYELPPERYQYNTGIHVEGVPKEEPVPKEDLDVPSARQDLLADLDTSQRRSTPSEWQPLAGRDTRPTVAVWDPVTSQLHHLPVCTKTEIQEAVKKFQAVYHVGVGGALDPPTLGLLSSPRCGNPDTIMEEPSTDQAPPHDLRHPAKDQNRPRRSALIRKKSKRIEIAGQPEMNQNHITPSDPQDPKASMISSEQANAEENLISTGRDPKETLPDQEALKTSEEEEAARSRHSSTSIKQYVEWEPDSSEALTRRRRWVQDLRTRIDSGEEDARLDSLKSHLASRRIHVGVSQGPNDPEGHNRDKRSDYNYGGQRFNEPVLTWRLVTAGYSSQLGVGAQRAALALAFRMWSEVIPPIFLEERDPALDFVAISVGFGKRSHLGCVTEFDGLGGELGHTLRPAQDAQIHMDDDEHFTLDSDHGTNLLKVAVHEIGHVLGLAHVVRNYSIMYPVYEKALPNLGFELGWEDRKLVQRIYGPCVGTFNTVFDFLRWRPDGSLTYNTYFFRRNRFWMYENKYNRTRFGDPLYVTQEWRGLPDNVDGYAHIWTRTKDIHLFFKDAYYYVYDPVAESVAPGYPRRIAQDFHGPPTSKRPQGRTIPNKIDTVYFDKRDENLYFFKGMKVWGYDVSKGASGCCLPGYPRKLRDEYLPASDSSRLLRRLDAVYYSYTDQTLFFIKFYWRMVSFDPQDKQRRNSIEGPNYVYDKWYDICDTELDPRESYVVSRR